MKPETIAFITTLLNERVNKARDEMMSSIDNGHDALIDSRIKTYRKALYAREDFYTWESEQKDGE